MKKSDVNIIIENYIQQESEYIKEHNKIIDILKPLEGKTINGQTLNKKRLNGFKFKHEYSMFYIVGKFEHLIGYSTENIISIEPIEGVTRGFKHFDACYGSAAENRIKQTQNLDIDKVVKVFGAIEKNFNVLRELFGDIEREKLGSFNNPVYYRLLDSIFDHEKEKGSYTNIRLTDFYYIRK